MTVSQPNTRLFGNLKIGTKLTIGLGLLAALTLLVVIISYGGSAAATEKINITTDVGMPTTLASSRAQADLLKMLGDVRGYLALGEAEYRTSYDQSSQAFQADLSDLKALSASFDPANRQRLQRLEDAFGQWSKLTDQLFDLRDNQQAREPAYNILFTDGARHAGAVLHGVGKLIDEQELREPTAENNRLLGQMARFQGSFAALYSGLRDFTITRNGAFRGEYQAGLDANSVAWENLIPARSSFTAGQQVIFDDMAANRDSFLALPDQMFAILASPSWRLDLFEFSTVAVPAANSMLTELNQITATQQDSLQRDLNQGRTGLAAARLQTLAGGGLGVILSVVLALILGSNIAGPIRRLTGVAEQVRAGVLEAHASVESQDEIGVLATTFNSMTQQLRQTLLQLRKEKKRADDLLEVVIPIGTRLSSEKDFNRLLDEMLLQTKAFCHADAGTLFLRNEDDQLEFVIVRNDTLGIALGGVTGEAVPFAPISLHDPATGEPNQRSLAARAALDESSINVAVASGDRPSDVATAEFQAGGGTYRALSALAIPLKSIEGNVLGIMQLFNAKDAETGAIIPFDANLQQMMESFSSLAVAALESYIREQKLHQQIEQLRIEIDESKRQKQVSEIVETDFFRDLQQKARELRSQGWQDESSPERTD